MSLPSDQHPVTPHSWWIRLNSWLWRGLLFLWGTVVVGLAVNIGATWLTTKGFDLKGIPLEWPAQHLPLMFASLGGLLLVTIASYTVLQRTKAPALALPQSLPMPSLQDRMALIHLLSQEYQRQLAQSLHGATIMQLQLQERTDVVSSPAQLVSWHLDDPDTPPLPHSTSIIEVYDHARAGLLILGAPGAGKSTVLRELANELVTRAERDTTLPIPVILSLSSWAQQKLPLGIWLVEQLQLMYTIPRHLGQAWMEQNQLLFLLDGFDEVMASERYSCVEAINHYKGEHFAPLVVCSRSKDYLSLQQQLKVPLAVEVQALTPQQVNDYLKHVGISMAAVRAALQSNATLRDLVTTPLMLSVVMLTYRGKRVKDLPSLGTAEQQQQQIFGQYVTHMLFQQTRTWRYTSQQTHLWLIQLAQQMQQHHMTEFYVERLQTTWLPTTWMFRLYPWINGLLFGLSSGLFAGLVGEQINRQVFGLSSGLYFGLSSGLLVGLASGTGSRTIKPVEKVAWSWKELSQPLFGSISKLLVAPLIGLSSGLLIGLRFGVLTGLLTGVFTGLLIGLIFGLTTTEFNENIRLEPNKGIYVSGKNTFIGLVFGVLTGLLFGVLSWLLFGLLTGLLTGLIFGLIFGLLFGLLFGGTAYFSHYFLRFFLWRSNVIPWQYVQFLNEAVDRILLRRIGGGYQFVHPLFQDYFASLDSSALPQQESLS